MKIHNIMKNVENNKAGFYKKMLAEEKKMLEEIRGKQSDKEKDDGSQKV